MFPVRKLVLFALLSATDFGLTWHLLRSGSGAVYEGNPVAAWWLGHYGWLGLAAFKAAMMTLAAGLGVLIFLRRPATGNRVLAFACAALGAVVLYSGYLCNDLRRSPAGVDADEAARMEESGQRLDEGLQRARAYRHVLSAASEDLRAGRCTLKEAVARLSVTEQAHDPAWMQRFELYYPGCVGDEALAVTLFNHINYETDRSAAGTALRRDFESQFVALYGHHLPSGRATRGSAGPV